MITFTIDRFRPTVLALPIGAVGNVGDRTLFADARANAIGIIAFVGDDDGALLEPLEQRFGTDGVVIVSGRNQEPDRAALRIDACVDFRGETASTSAHTTISTLFFTPEAC